MEGSHSSLWIDTRPGRRFGPLARSVRTEVAVVGAGITGITTAALLARAGRRVVLIDADRIAEGVSGFTTAHLTEVIDSRYHVLIPRFGVDGARLARESQRAAIERIASFVSELRIDCAFRRVRGYLFTERAEQIRDLEEEQEAFQKIGLRVPLAPSAPVPFDTEGALVFENQATFHPREYLLALVADLKRAGVAIHEHTRALSIEDGEPCVIETERGTIVADDVVVATDSPIANRVLVHTKIAPYRSYVIAAPARRRVEDALFWDLEDPYHYVRVQAVEGETFAIVGGEDHKVGTGDEPERRWTQLERWTHARFDVGRSRWRWSAQVMEPVDGLPYVGRNPLSAHTWIATGYSGNGMTNGTMAGMLISEEILGHKSEWRDLYDPTRIKPLSSAAKFISENAGFPLHLVSDRVRPAEAHAFSEVAPGEGKLVSHRGSTLAVFRDDGGSVHALSATCTHLWCHVKFNSAEKSWDCPCHGSRFGVDGNVIHGPATHALEPVRIEDQPEEEERV